ncbi:MAG: hypothetical protein HOV83_18800 [Catenulispora sp.]|nr:hypothetical protein [Catenulispora sp.]
MVQDQENAMKRSENEVAEGEAAPESLEALEEMREQTAETVAEARKEVDRAIATSHDQLLPAAQGGVVGDYEDEEGVPEKDDTRGAWPDWTKRRDEAGAED